VQSTLIETSAMSIGIPEIFNSKQVSQFAHSVFTSVLEREGVVNQHGRALDKVFVE